MNAIAQVSAARLSGPKLDNRRVLAAIVDLLIVAAGALVVLYAGDSLTGERQGALGAVIAGWALYYYFALESGAGQTVGKKLMKLRVVRADGRPADMREIAVRTVLRVVDGIGVYIVGLIVMLVTGERRQRIGDLAAGTIVVDASGPATAVVEPAASEPEVEADEHEDEPVNASPDPTRTITLPSRPAPPQPLSGADEEETEVVAEESAAEPVAEHQPVLEFGSAVEEPTVEVEPVADEPVAEFEPVRADDEALVEDEPAAEAESFQVESFEVEPYEVEPIELESVVPVEPTVDVDEPRAEESVVPVDPTGEAGEPQAEEELPSAMSASLEGLAADVAAAQETSEEDAQDEGEDEAPQDDEPVNVKSVETVSAMDLIMGAAEEDSAKSGEDDAPASA